MTECCNDGMSTENAEIFHDRVCISVLYSLVVPPGISMHQYSHSIDQHCQAFEYPLPPYVGGGSPCPHSLRVGTSPGLEVQLRLGRKEDGPSDEVVLSPAA